MPSQIFIVALVGRAVVRYVATMSNFLLGIALISASLQTSWALVAEDHLLALPLAGLALHAGWRCLPLGPAEI